MFRRAAQRTPISLPLLLAGEALPTYGTTEHQGFDDIADLLLRYGSEALATLANRAFGSPSTFFGASLLLLFILGWICSIGVCWDTIRYDTIRYDTIRYDTIRYDTIRYDTIRYLLRHWMLAWLRRSLCPPSAWPVRHRPGPPWRQSPSASRLVSPSPQLQPLIAKVGGNMVTIYTSYVFIIVA